MNLPSEVFSLISTRLLNNPGDKLIAMISPKGKEIIKLFTGNITRTAVRYPETGTIVETIVRRFPK